MKQLKFIICIVLIISIMTGLLPISAVEILDETTVSYEERRQVDPYEVKKGFSNKTAWKEHVRTRNKFHKKDALKHETIQAELEENGIAGLNKYQYHQVLVEEQPKDFSEDTLLISFIDEKIGFDEKSNNDLFDSIKSHSDYCVGILKEKRTASEMIDLIGILVQDSNVDMIQPNFIYEAASATSITADYTYTLTRAMEQVKATDAWNYYTGEGVLVGMIDTGVNVVAGQNKHSGSNSDTCSLFGCGGHGTAVSAVINGNGTYAGVALDSTVYCVGDHGHDSNDNVVIAYSSNIGEYIDQLVNAGCRIINMSLAIRRITRLDAFLEKLQQYNENVLFIQAAGNVAQTSGESTDDDYLDENQDLDTESTYTYYNNSNYIRVAAVDMNDDIPSLSYYGAKRVHIAAPGYQLSLPTKDGTMELMSGTSFAAPFVSGTAALLLEADPTLTPSELKSAILSSADFCSNLYQKVQGCRRLNVMAAVESVDPPTGGLHISGRSNNWFYLVNNQGSRIVKGAKKVLPAPNGFVYQTTGNELYYLPGPLSSNTTPVLIPDTQNTVSFAASWGNLVVYNGSTLRRYIFNETSQNYVYNNVTHSNVKYYALSGNRLVLYYTIATKFRVYENFRTSLTYEHYNVNGTVNALWVTGSRIHVYQNDGIYQMFDSVADSRPSYAPATTDDTTNRKFLAPVCEETNFSFITSMNATRWCYAEGNQIYVYHFTEWGTDCSTKETTPTTITSPNGANISSVKIINDIIYYCAGGVLYASEIRRNVRELDGDDLGSVYYYTLADSVDSYSCCGESIGYIDTSGNFYYYKGELNPNWPTPEQGWTLKAEEVTSINIYY